jgi:hypothetical protein
VSEFGDAASGKVLRAALSRLDGIDEVEERRRSRKPKPKPTQSELAEGEAVPKTADVGAASSSSFVKQGMPPVQAKRRPWTESPWDLTRAQREAEAERRVSVVFLDGARRGVPPSV